MANNRSTHAKPRLVLAPVGLVQLAHEDLVTALPRDL